MNQRMGSFKKYFGKLIQVILSCEFLFAIILAFGIISDLEYYGNLYLLQKFKFIRWSIELLRKCGLHYSNALQLLQGSFGILITAVNFIFTMSINITDRSGKKVFGFSRQELNHLRQNRFYRGMKRLTYFTPLLLAIAIILNWCITGYIILLFGYMFLIHNHKLYEHSYGRQKEIESVANYLFNIIKEYENKADWSKEYGEKLEFIRIDTERESNWIEIAQLYDEIRKRILTLPANIRTMAIYRFFDIIYATHFLHREDIAIEQIKKQISIVEHENKINEDEYMVLCGMWNTLFKRFDKENLLDFIEWFSNAALRSYNMMITDNQKIEDEIWIAESGLLLIYIENWLQNEKQELNLNIDTIRNLWEIGKAFLQKDNNSLINELFETYGRIDENIKEIQQSYEQLYKDIKFNGSLSCVCSILV